MRRAKKTQKFVFRSALLPKSDFVFTRPRRKADSALCGTALWPDIRIALGGAPARVDPNGEYQIDQMYVQYFVPFDAKGAVR
jgi:hypothetical protein